MPPETPHPRPQRHRSLSPAGRRPRRVALESQKALPQTPAPPIAGWPASSAGVSGPFPPPALPGFDGPTNPSAPAPRIGTRPLGGRPLVGLPWHRGNRFPRSAQDPLAGLTPSSCRSPLGQSAGSRRALSQANNWSLVLATSLRFRHVSNGSLTRLTSAHLTGLIPPFAATLTTSAIGPTQLAVVWTLILQSEPEGPTLISCAARLPGVDRYMTPSSRRRGAQSSAYEMTRAR